MDAKDLEMFRAKLKKTGSLFVLAEHRTTGIAEIVHPESVHGISPSELAACPTCKEIPEDSDLADMLAKYKYTIN
jgi:hypothetical protein